MKIELMHNSTWWTRTRIYFCSILPGAAYRSPPGPLQVHLLLCQQNRDSFMQPALHRHVVVPEHVLRHLQVPLRHQRSRAVVEGGPVAVGTGGNLPVAACAYAELE